jgi:Lar family restriction alleviation protein
VSVTILPCPFCGAGENDACVQSGRITDGVWVQCICGATGPYAKECNEAINGWNRRVESPAQMEEK